MTRFFGFSPQQRRFSLDSVLGLLELGTQRRFLDRRQSDIRRQRQIGCLKREALRVRLRRYRFDLTPNSAKHVRSVRDRQRSGVQQKNGDPDIVGEMRSPVATS
jgi:hypothetical protein